MTISNRPDLLNKLKEAFEKHFKLNKDQFKNDFGDLQTFEEIFVFNKKLDEFEIKIGVLDKEFFSEEFMEYIKEIKGNKVIFFCNECGVEFHTYSIDNEPERCSCGADNFGIMD